MASEMLENTLFDLAKLKGLGGYQAGDLLAVDSELYSKFMKHLSKTVKRDATAKNMVFLTALSSFTLEPINLFLRGDTSIGKTYNVTQVLKYFPQEDMWLLGGISPTALVHDRGKLVDKNGEEIILENKPLKPRKTDYGSIHDYEVALKDYGEAKELWIKRLKESHYVVDLSGKILVFLEAPQIETFNRLRPILSHDAFEISYKFTDKSAKGSLQTQHVVIRGFPATIFCSTDEKYVRDLATRSFTITPETTSKKYHEANVLTGSKAALPWKFQRDVNFNLLEGYIRFLRNNSAINVLVPYGEEFADTFPSRFPRAMRDFKHILNLIKVSALFHFAQRPTLVCKTGNVEGCYAMATAHDYIFVMELWKKVRETTQTSASSNIIEFFHKVVEKVAGVTQQFTVQDLVEEWNSRFEEKKSSRRIREWINFLCDIGYMTKQPNPGDKRSNLLSVIKGKNGEHDESRFGTFFTLNSFKAWSDNVETLLPETEITFRENSILNDAVSIEEVFKKYFLIKDNNSRNNVLSDSKTSLGKSTEEKTRIEKTPQYPFFNIDEVLKLERLTTNIQDTCVLCGFQGRMDWQVTQHNGEWGMFCGQCGHKVADKLKEAG